MIFKTVILLAAALASAAPKSEVRNVRIFSPKLSVSRPRSDSEAVVVGQFRVDMSFSQTTVKKPVLRLVSICEVDGELVVHNVILDKLRTNDPMKRAEIMNAYKQAGVDIPYKEREQAYSDPARFTPYLSEVTKDAYAGAAYGAAEVKRGLFRLGKSVSPPKILLFRLELWQNGAMAASWESSNAGLGKYALPADWHVWRKHPQKFRYVSVQ